MAITRLNNNSITSITALPSAVDIGLVEIDMFRLTTSISGTVTLSSNFERVDEADFNKVGTGMTESSGVFTFPKTGVYSVLWSGSNYGDGGADAQVNIQIQTSTDGGSNWGVSAMNFHHLHTGEQTTFNVQCIVDVTNTSNNKVRFVADTNANGQLQGNSNLTYNGFTFIRLGNT